MSIKRVVAIVLFVCLIAGRRFLHGPAGELLLVGLAFVYLTFEMVRSLKIGQVDLLLGGVATREGRPDIFWRHIYTDGACLVALVGVTLWIVLSPATFR